MKKKSEQASVIIRNQGSAPASLSQGNRLLNERVAKNLEKEEACIGVSQPSVQTSTPSAIPVGIISKGDLSWRRVGIQSRGQSHHCGFV